MRKSPAPALPRAHKRPPCDRRPWSSRCGASRWGLGTALSFQLLLCLAGCPAPLSSTTPAPGSAADGPPQLVCYAATGELVAATADGRRQVALRVQPPAELVALAAADGTLVGASPGKVWALARGDAATRRWYQVARWEPLKWSPEPLRAASYGKSAVVWMRGNDPGTVPAALEVTAAGQVIKEAVSVAEQSLGGIWQSSGAPLGPYDLSFPEPLRLLIREVRMSGQFSREELFHSERSPWGGRLVAPNLGLPSSGDWPEAPLFYLGIARDTVPVPLQYQGEPLRYRGLIGYGAAAQLYLDGRFSALGQGVLVVAPPGSPGQSGSSKQGRPLEARVVPGLRPPCAIVGADWHE